MDFFLNIIILPVLTTFSYYKTIFHESKLFDPTLFTVIYGYFQNFGYF